MSFAANPRANNPQQGDREATGIVTSDSLAAESIRDDEGFAENDASISGVKGSNSTVNTTDTSAASALPAARDGATREQLEARGLGSDERGHTGVKYPDTNPDFSGTHSSQGYAGGPSKQSSAGTYSGDTGDSFGDTTTGSSNYDDNIRSGSNVRSSGANTSSGGGYRSSENDYPIATGRAGDDFGVAQVPERDTAPNYAATVSGAIQREGDGQPKGTNLTEGDMPATKTFIGNVGGKNDPGRLAEQDFQKMNARTAGSSGYVDDGDSRGGAFDALSSERA